MHGLLRSPEKSVRGFSYSFPVENVNIVLEPLKYGYHRMLLILITDMLLLILLIVIVQPPQPNEINFTDQFLKVNTFKSIASYVTLLMFKNFAWLHNQLIVHSDPKVHVNSIRLGDVIRIKRLRHED